MFEIYYAMFELQVQRLQNSLTELQMPSQVSGFKHCTRTLICRGKLLREDCIWTFKPVPAFGNWKTHVVWMFELNQGQLDFCVMRLKWIETPRHQSCAVECKKLQWRCKGSAMQRLKQNTPPSNKTHVLQRANDSTKMEKVKSDVSFDVFFVGIHFARQLNFDRQKAAEAIFHQTSYRYSILLGFCNSFCWKTCCLYFATSSGRHSQLQKKQLHRWHRSHWNLGTKPLSFVKRDAMVTAFEFWNSQESYSHSNSALRSLQLLAGMAQLISKQFF